MACILHPLSMNTHQLSLPHQSNTELTATVDDTDDVNLGVVKTKGMIDGNKSSSSANLPKLNFPAKLQLILSTPEFNDIICWLPHGRAWRVQQQEKLESEILPKFFQHQKAASFFRQVTGWGFHRVVSGTDFNAYYHELFLRDAPELCHRMKRPKRSELAERKRGLSKAPPDFYVMPPVSATKGDPLDPSFASHHMTMDEYKAMLMRRLSTYSMNEKGMYLQLELNRLEKRHSEIQKQLEDLGKNDYPSNISKPTAPPPAAISHLHQPQMRSLEAQQMLLVNDLQSIRSLDQRNDIAMPLDRLQLARLQLLQHVKPEAQSSSMTSQMALANYLLGAAPAPLDGALGNDSSTRGYAFNNNLFG